MLVVLIVFVYWKWEEKILIVFFGTLCLLAILDGIYSAITRLNSDNPASAELLNNRPSIKFISKPNFYVFFTESLPRIDNIYNLDMNKLSSFLTNQGFIISKKSYCNYAPTAHSMLSLIDQKHHYYKYNIGNHNLNKIGLQKISPETGYVYSIFRNNGYIIKLINREGRLSTTNIDGTSYVGISDNKYSVSYFMQPILDMGPHLRKIFDRRNEHKFRVPTLEDKTIQIPAVQNTLKNAIEENNIKNAKHCFYFINYDVLHEAPKLGATCKIRRQKWHDEYVKSYKLLEKALIEDITNILNHDQNSVILLIGDHGSRHYAVCRCLVTTDLDHFIKSHGFSYPWLTEDLFSTMIAMRLPHKQFYNIDGLSHVNIFMHIFSLLANNPEIIKCAEQSNSYAFIDRKYLRLVKRGDQLLNPWMLVPKSEMLPLKNQRE